MDHHYYYQDYDKFRVGYTVWETTEYPDKIFSINKKLRSTLGCFTMAKRLYCKTRYDKEKVKVVPEAVNSKVFYPNDKSTLPEYKDKRFKFILFGRWDYRKSTKEIIEAFLDEFDKNEKVDLVLSIDNVFAKDGFKQLRKD